MTTHPRCIGSLTSILREPSRVRRRPHRWLPPILLGIAFATFAVANDSRTVRDNVATAAAVPDLADIDTADQRLAPVLSRYLRDLESVEHVHDVRGGIRREAALRAFHRGWQERLAQIDYDALGTEDRIDWQLLSRELRGRLQQLDFERSRFEEAGPLLPQLAPLLALAEARRNLEEVEAAAAAGTLERARVALVAAQAGIDALREDRHRPTAAVANRAAHILDATREQLRAWFEFRAGYDPQFTWWVGQPHAALETVMKDYAAALRARLADAADPETIVGDPIGREALLRDLVQEMIAYTPEELIGLAERELAWCHAELARAAREMGQRDWRAALEAVKSRHEPPGGQPRLVVELADEAIEFVTSRNLVTVPELARRDWRMSMLDAKAQLQSPFFLGGEDVWVSFPTADMPYDRKLDSLRGNNRHFSRAVVHHELIPGHHLQHFMTTRYRPQRGALGWNAFWGEGWALYWEFLLYERGFASTPEDRIGMLFWRSHRAARILFSLGFHLGKLTPEESIDLLVERVGHERENAAAEVRRSFAGDYGPLYQIAYMIGGLQFRALHAEQVGSGRMDDRSFHDAILRGGPMPVELVRARLSGQPLPRDIVASWRFYDLD